MLNFRTIHKRAEEHLQLVIVGIFVLLILLVAAQSIFSPLAVLGLVVSLIFIVLTFVRPLWSLFFLAVYLPLEPFFLKFIPDDLYVFARYFSEGIIYLLCLVVLVRFISGKLKTRPTPIDLPFVFFVIALISSAIINLVSPEIAILGMRQILRFILVFFLVVYLRPPKAYLHTLTITMLVLVIGESLLGLLQAVLGAPLDAVLLPSEARAFGDITLTSGVSQFWDPGSRVFATLGRYDRLGNFLYFFLLLGAAMFYEKKFKLPKYLLPTLFITGISALLLTFSRASWFAFILGFLFIALWIKKDRRVWIGFVSLVVVAFLYLGLSGLNVRFITEGSGQTLAERFYETFSYARWQGEYYGLGRVYWLVQTQLRVIPASPIFGFGPGQFGGGVVAALHNTRVYEQLGLPFGIYGSEGHIDNNWFSLWGEVGTLGMILYLWIYSALFVFAVRVYSKTRDAFTRIVALGLAAAMIGMAFNAFLSTLFEIRTIAFYLWFYAGVLMVLSEREKLSAEK